MPLKAVVMLLLQVSACATVSTTPRAPWTTAAPDLEQRALLLLLEERRLWEPVTVQAGLGGDAGLRELLARVLGRIRDPRSVDVLLELIVDPEVAVRRSAAFALGHLPGKAARDGLVAAASDPDPETARRALAALARSGAGAVLVSEAVADLDPDALWTRLLPALFSLPPERRLAAARLARDQTGVESGRQLAALAIASTFLAEAAEDLRRQLTDSGPWVRGWSLTALAAVDPAGAGDIVTDQLADPHPFVRTRALLALATLLDRGRLRTVPELEQALLDRVTDASAGVRLAALAALGSWPPSAATGAALEGRFQDREAPLGERCAALVSAVLSGTERAPDLVAHAAVEEDAVEGAVLRSCAAAVGTGILSGSRFESLLADRSPRVRGTALRSAFEAGTFGRLEMASRFLGDPEPAVRATLYDLLAERPIVDLETLLDSDSPALGRMALESVEPHPEARATLLGAVSARGESERLERGAALLVLEAAATRDPSPMVRLEASRLLGAAPARSSPAPASLDFYRELALRTGSARRLRFETDRGSFAVELDCPSAPRTCVHWTQLAGQGFLRGQRFTLEPGLELRAGDPDGLGWGGPGYFLRDEPTPLAFDRPGILTMERRFEDGVASRFAITLSPQPWRSGREVAVGVVVAGLEVLDRIQSGDRILAVVAE